MISGREQRLYFDHFGPCAALLRRTENTTVSAMPGSFAALITSLQESVLNVLLTVFIDASVEDVRLECDYFDGLIINPVID